MQPLVSICCITYNHASYIRQCLDGFLMQKVTFPIEIIINDDCSTDGTTDIICEYEAKYPDLIKPIYHTENEYSKGVRGMFATYCFPKAKGKYIAMCEGDDYWIDPLKLQKQVDFMESNPDYFLCGTNGIVKYEGIERRDKMFNDIVISKELLPQDIIGHWVLPTASLLFRREIYIDYPEWTRKVYSGDQTLILLSMNKGRIYAFSDVCCIYRRDVDNKSSVSMNVRRTRSRAYVISQHIILYNEFNKYTKGRYANIINSLLKSLTKQERAYQMMDKSIFLAALHYPITFCSIVLNKFKRSR